MIKIYRKTDTIRAEQFDGSNEMIEKYNITPPMPLDPDYTINTLEGDMVLGVGDWVATGIKGEHWAIADDVFKKTYAELPVIPKDVAERIITGHSLNDLIPTLGGIYRAMIQTVVYGYQKGDIGDWIVNHSDVFARAWLDGYQVEEEHD
ncbi:DUF1642 domain-containing protein [Lactiplantibacillus plantarum]|uniref:DUF1642 domain-containing protein n=1 Tax=Lactiplantibacillus plantarum TaxID=1590 RepID=UPI00264DB1F0|nr:DUF1642 domain-containing protein [Lactiplantibacillus plantarum]MDN7071536.1 DUF1642 domain-containing protein [Lactiplantibacillus plantarum]